MPRKVEHMIKHFPVRFPTSARVRAGFHTVAAVPCFSAHIGRVGIEMEEVEVEEVVGSVTSRQTGALTEQRGRRLEGWEEVPTITPRPLLTV